MESSYIELFEAIMSTEMYGSHLLEKNLLLEEEFDNCFDKFAVKVLNGEETVGHLPREYLRIAWYFLARRGSISLEVSGHRRHCKQLCGGMEIPCRVKFTLLKEGNVKPVKRSFNEEGLIIV